MKRLTETLKTMLDALAHADAGEFLSRREKAQVLGRGGLVGEPAASAEAPRAKPASNARRIALYLGSELPPEVMTYVVQTCVHLQHELTVVTFQTEGVARALLQPHESALREAGIDMKLVTLSGDLKHTLARYLRGQPEIAFLACKDSGYLGRSYLKGTYRNDDLPVPVVVVTTAKSGARAPAQTAAEQQDDSTNVA